MTSKNLTDRKVKSLKGDVTLATSSATTTRGMPSFLASVSVRRRLEGEPSS
jgi:hypothetical protein